MGATILVLDDDSYMRELLNLHLSNAGYEVLLAEDAVVAGHLLLRQRPDLMLVDVEMPYMNGLEFMQALKGDPAVCNIPVVFISSRDDCEDRAKELGAGAFLHKPLLADHLLATVAGFVEGGRIAL
jgi:two-component system chemotaxis response regulator CheY